MVPRAPADLLTSLQKATKYRIHGYQYTNKYQQGVWDGYKHLFYKRDQSAPSGCYARLVRLLEEEGHDVNVVFENDVDLRGTGEIHGLTLEKFQTTAVKRSVFRRYCILSAPVRSGKTAIIASILSRIAQVPMWVITSGKDLVLQTKKDLEKLLKVPVGMFSEGVFENEKIVVASYEALRRAFSDLALAKNPDSTRKVSPRILERNTRIRKIVRKVKAVLLDECHLVFSKEHEKFLSEFVRVGYKIGLSGTPKPDDKKLMELERGIGPIVMRVPYKKLIDKKRIAQPLIIVYNLPHTWFRHHLPEYHDSYQANIVENHFRNRFIAQVVEKLWAQNMTSFIMICRKYHGEILRDLIPKSVYVYGDVASSVRRKLYNRLQKKELHCIISTVGKLGLNLPKLNAVINAEGLKSSVATMQKMRSLTAHEEKRYGIIIDFGDKGKDIIDHSEDRIARYNSIAGFIVKHRKVRRDHFDLKVA